MKRLLVKDLLWELDSVPFKTGQNGPEYAQWVRNDVVNIAKEFVQKNKLTESCFVKGMNDVFKTTRFEILLKRWVVEYLKKLFSILDYFMLYHSQLNKELVLEDVALNRLVVEKYYFRFGVSPKIKWRKRPNLLQKIFSILLRSMVILRLSLNKGLKISGKREKYKVMREAIWGLHDINGYYFRDDFMVDEYKIKKEDILLFSRRIPAEAGKLKGRSKAYHDAKKSCYKHFNLQSLSLGIKPLFLRIIPKYIISGSKALFKEIFSGHFSLYWSVYSCFLYNALLYEKVFSHFEIVSELGHNYFSTSCIVEAIICQNHGTKHYLMHWSDFSLPILKFQLSFLGCDGFLIWGNVHGQGIEIDPQILMPIGYVFKRFVKEVASNRNKILSDMGIDAKGKIISFFDESFGGTTAMTEENFVVFWRTILKVAQHEQANTIVVKPKGSSRYKLLSDELKREFLEISDRILKMENIYVIDENKWSFIEAIGISDITVTQGMTSSATIAIVCGIEGLYLDQVGYEHPFAELFKDKIVFDNPEKLVNMIHRIVIGKESPRKDIPERLLREFDEYADDRGIDLFRDILSGSEVGVCQTKK